MSLFEVTWVSNGLRRWRRSLENISWVFCPCVHPLRLPGAIKTYWNFYILVVIDFSPHSLWRMRSQGLSSASMLHPRNVSSTSVISIITLFPSRFIIAQFGPTLLRFARALHRNPWDLRSMCLRWQTICPISSVPDLCCAWGGFAAESSAHQDQGRHAQDMCKALPHFLWCPQASDCAMVFTSIAWVKRNKRARKILSRKGRRSYSDGVRTGVRRAGHLLAPARVLHHTVLLFKVIYPGWSATRGVLGRWLQVLITIKECGSHKGIPVRSSATEPRGKGDVWPA